MPYDPTLNVTNYVIDPGGTKRQVSLFYSLLLFSHFYVPPARSKGYQQQAHCGTLASTVMST
jgi:hypothetical protein